MRDRKMSALAPGRQQDLWRPRDRAIVRRDPNILHAEGGMPVYMADRELPGVTLAQLADAQRAAIATSREFTARGKRIRYLRSMYVPSEWHCMCLFEADDADTVRELNETAGIPFNRIVVAVDLSP
jgi:muconolactone delta-isomerase